MALTDKLTAIANAIRQKTGNTDKITLDQFVTEIEGIETGGGDIDALIDGSLTEITSNVDRVSLYKFYKCTNLITADFPNAVLICSSAFRDCFSLTMATLPNVITLEGYAFRECTSLTTVDFSNLTGIGTEAFRDCYNLTSVILRGAEVAELNGTTVFSLCYHILGTANDEYNPDGLKDGYFYVPRSLVAEYQAATNWSTYETQFRALEDYTVDGTITGELDESKVNS